AMKAREKGKLEALRAVKSAILLARTEKGSTKDLRDEDEIRLLQKLVKQRKESAEIFKEHGREDLYEKEWNEKDIIETFLPQQLSESELESMLTDIIKEVGANAPLDMGKVMAIASKKLVGRADGKKMAAKVREILNKS
ncbi:GatB/YqeY domain-containing protein, partial [Bacteroidota bacterium]